MSSILHPQIVVIGNRRYRKNPIKTFQTTTDLQPYEEETDDMFIENRQRPKFPTPTSIDVYDDEISCKLEYIPNSENSKCKSDQTVKIDHQEDEEEEYDDIVFESNMYKLKMNVSESYFGFIIGRNGEKKNNLERETQTQIRIPNKRGNDFLTIEGKTKSSVASCRNRLILLISSARHQKQFTHLLTFPINFDLLKSKFATFKEQVLKNCSNDEGIDETIFQIPNKFHLTICTLTLLNKIEIQQAKELLEECNQTFIKDFVNERNLKIRVKGLEYMNDDPSKVDVLYAKIEPVNGNSIQKIVDKLLNKFADVGLSKKQYDRVKLHATVMNTLKRRNEDSQEKSQPIMSAKDMLLNRERESFDARNVLKQFGDFDFGEFVPSEIHLSLRFSTGSDGYYECISKIKF